LFLIIMSGLFATTSLSVCTFRFHDTITPSCSVTDLGMCGASRTSCTSGLHRS
jgi:hypothetical protein